MDTEEITERALVVRRKKNAELLAWILEQIKKKMREIGEHLKSIKEGELWDPKKHDSFDAFCRDEFGFGNKRANQLIAAHDFRLMLGGKVKDEPELADAVAKMKEGPAREMAKVPEDKQVEVLKEALKADKLSAPTIKMANARVIGTEQNLPMHTGPDRGCEPARPPVADPPEDPDVLPPAGKETCPHCGQPMP